tara:strand:+ start:2212 stop:2418 length:207 start_codon:yes stop_codon:yes gene_type:complete
MKKHLKRIDTASTLANAALARALDVEVDKKTQLLALSELAYRVQAVIKSIEGERKTGRREGSSPSGQD